MAALFNTCILMISNDLPHQTVNQATADLQLFLSDDLLNPVTGTATNVKEMPGIDNTSSTEESPSTGSVHIGLLAQQLANYLHHILVIVSSALCE